jgi:hypothetical protein
MSELIAQSPTVTEIDGSNPGMSKMKNIIFGLLEAI